MLLPLPPLFAVSVCTHDVHGAVSRLPLTHQPLLLLLVEQPQPLCDTHTHTDTNTKCTSCILDTTPRQFSADSTVLLTQLANMVMREVERKRAMNAALCSAAVRHQR